MNETLNDVPEPAGDPPRPQLDTITLLYNCDNDFELARGVLEQTMAVTPERLRRLTASIHASNGASIHSEAHTMAGTFLMIGATALGDLARQVEQDAESDRFFDMSDHLRLLQTCYTKLTEEIEAFLAEAHPMAQ